MPKYLYLSYFQMCPCQPDGESPVFQTNNIILNRYLHH